jgi:hypothetical protein
METKQNLTPAANAAGVTTTENGLQTVQLSKGVATISDFKGKHIMEATKVAEGDAGKMIFALIAITTTIDGKKIVMEDLLEMNGKDVLKLQAAFSVNF